MAQQTFKYKKDVRAHMRIRNYTVIGNGRQIMEFERRDTSHRIAEWRYMQTADGWRWTRIY